MAVTLNTQGLGSSADPSIIVSSQNKQFRIQRLKKDLDRKFVEDDVQARAKLLGYPYVDLYGFPIDTFHLTILPQSDVEKYKIGIFALKNKEVMLVTSNLHYPGQEAVLNRLTEMGYTHKIYLCSEFSLEKLISTYRFVIDVKNVKDDIEISKEKFENSDVQITNLQSLQDIINKSSVSDIIEVVLITALNNDASDIHFEPEKDEFILRLRLDGVLHTFARLPKELHKSIENRIKLIAGLKLNIDNLPQEGRFSFNAKGKNLDVRVSMLPSSYGYSTVMRLLGTGGVDLKLDNLGFGTYAIDLINNAIAKPQGLILVTGPTGSGKTTSLYTFLNALNDGENKIITLEDPVEYKLSGISQTQVDSEAGYTFSSGLKSILRQDPDVVMVGEIREKDTADIAIQASLTGHKVLSTLHTNDAAGSVTRLLEMEVKGYLLADALELIIGQRLVRKLCNYCKKDDYPTDQQKATIVQELQKISPKSGLQIPHNLSFQTSTGCEKCHGVGYKGRIGLYEVMNITDNLKFLLSNKTPSVIDIRLTAQNNGMITMLQDGILKALDGITDLKEIFKNIM